MYQVYLHALPVHDENEEFSNDQGSCTLNVHVENEEFSNDPGSCTLTSQIYMYKLFDVMP
jgi:hypothetical protein